MKNLKQVLKVYREHPMRNGDVALLTDLQVVQEIEGLADQWDAELRRNIAYVLTDLGVRELQVGQHVRMPSCCRRTTRCGPTCARSCSARRSRCCP